MEEAGICSRLDVVYPARVHVLEAWSPVWHYWQVVDGTLKRWGLVGGNQVIGGITLGRD
jgi:hypothetical protein